MSRLNRRRLFSTALHTIALALTVGCSRGDDASRSQSSQGETFRVALLTPGPISDRSWNAGAYAGLLAIRDSLGASVSHIQTKTPAEFDENFRQYGAQGYNLVFGHGYEFQDAAKRVAPEFPKTIYVTTSGTAAGPNYTAMQFGFSDASYLAGVLAGAMTKTGRIGMIGGTELPPVVESFRAFEAGARSVNPSIRAITSYIGNWDDVSAGKEQALAQLSQGVDVIFQNADAAGLGIFQAVREKKDAYIFGSNSDQNAIAPEVTIGSVVIDLPLALLTIARQVKAGEFQPKVVQLGAPSHVVKFVINPALQSRIPEAAQKRVLALEAEMLQGTFSASPIQASRGTAQTP